MRIAYRAETLIDAHLVKDALERAEIPAFVSGEYLTGAVGQLPAIDYVVVLVPEASLAAAEQVVREVERDLLEARRAMAESDEDPDAPQSVFC
jgi:Putative prokaryotic signal transducing protein